MDMTDATKANMRNRRSQENQNLSKNARISCFYRKYYPVTVIFSLQNELIE